MKEIIGDKLGKNASVK